MMASARRYSLPTRHHWLLKRCPEPGVRRKPRIGRKIVTWSSQGKRSRPLPLDRITSESFLRPHQID